MSEELLLVIDPEKINNLIVINKLFNYIKKESGTLNLGFTSYRVITFKMITEWFKLNYNAEYSEPWIGHQYVIKLDFQNVETKVQFILEWL